MQEQLKEQVCRANLRLVEAGLVEQTWGNVSGLDREAGLFAIKPSGVAYDALQPDQIVLVSLDTGEVVEGDLRPSSDTPTHRELYLGLLGIGGIVHTHSLHATAFAQAHKPIPPLGTTHADYFYGAVPCTRPMREEEIRYDYEAQTGRLIVETMAELDPAGMSACLVDQHGPFAWGGDAEQAVEAAVTLELVARLAAMTLAIQPYPRELSQPLLDKHFLRKHGKNAYYGQTKKGSAS